MKTSNEIPPANTRRIYSWADLPNLTEPASYLIENKDQEPFTITVSKHARQVLEGSMRFPIYSASYCRIGDVVFRLKEDHRIDFETVMYQGDPDTKRMRFGVYFLRSKVTRHSYLGRAA